MFCPKCRSEYREGFLECSDCQIPLVTRLPDEEPAEPNAEMVEIFHSTNPLEISLAKSLLDDANIEYAVIGEDLRFLLGAGGGGLAGNPTTGPPRILVRREDQKKTLQILEEMPEALESDSLENETD